LTVYYAITSIIHVVYNIKQKACKPYIFDYSFGTVSLNTEDSIWKSKLAQ